MLGDSQSEIISCLSITGIRSWIELICPVASFVRIVNAG